MITEDIYLDTGGKKNCLSEAEYFLENWNDMLAGETFQSKLIEFTLEEAKAMTDYRDITRKAYYSKREGRDCSIKDALASESRTLVFGPTDFYPHVDDIDDSIMSILAQIESKLNEEIELYPNGCFVKLNSRSPKDTSLIREDFSQFLRKEINSTLFHSFDNNYVNDDLLDSIAFHRATGSALIVKSGKEAMLLLLQSSRIYDDIKLYLNNFEARNYNPLKLIVRKWEDIDPKVRAFVYGNKIQVMTQYSPYYYNPDFAKLEKKLVLENLILDYFQNIIAPKVTLKDYTIDFAFSRDYSKLWVVELNPPPPVAGCSLFNVREACLKEGPYEFRTVDNPEDACSFVPREILKESKIIRIEEKQKEEDKSTCLVQ